jgi:hypothetical protein
MHPNIRHRLPFLCELDHLPISVGILLAAGMSLYETFQGTTLQQ